MHWFYLDRGTPPVDVELLGLTDNGYDFVTYHNGYFWNRNKQLVNVIKWAYLED